MDKEYWEEDTLDKQNHLCTCPVSTKLLMNNIFCHVLWTKKIIVFLTSPRHFKIKTLDLNKTSLSLESFSGSAMIVWLISFYCSGNTGDALGDTWDWVLSVVLQSSRRDSRDHRPRQLRHQLHPLLSHVLPVQEHREEDAWSGQDSLHHHTINWCQENVKF